MNGITNLENKLGVFSNKKKKTDKFGKTMQKLPDLNNVG